MQTAARQFAESSVERSPCAVEFDKEDALRLVQQLPANATWEDLQYEIYVRQAIEAGLRDSGEGRTVPATMYGVNLIWTANEGAVDRIRSR